MIVTCSGAFVFQELAWALLWSCALTSTPGNYFRSVLSLSTFRNIPSKHRVYSSSPQSNVFFLNSILPTAFIGTAMIFTCFTLSALYARRRTYLFLGGKCGLENPERVRTLARILTRTVPSHPNCLWLWGWSRKPSFWEQHKEWLWQGCFTLL